MVLLLMNLAEYFVVGAKSDRVAYDNDELDWWQTAVFYQIYPRSFKDSNGDGVGDLKGNTDFFFFPRRFDELGPFTGVRVRVFLFCVLGIEEKVEHFNDIGVDCVWLSPIFKSPMADFGYDISDYNRIDGIYGTIDDFVSLQAKLKSLGNYKYCFVGVRVARTRTAR